MSEYTPSEEYQRAMRRREEILAKDPDAAGHWLREQAEKERRLFGKVLTRQDWQKMSLEEAEAVSKALQRPLSEFAPLPPEEQEPQGWFDRTYYQARELYGADVMDSLPFEEKYRRYYAVATPEEREEMRAYVRDSTHGAYTQAMREAYQRVLALLDTMEEPELESGPEPTGTEEQPGEEEDKQEALAELAGLFRVFLTAPDEACAERAEDALQRREASLLARHPDWKIDADEAFAAVHQDERARLFAQRREEGQERRSRRRPEQAEEEEHEPHPPPRPAPVAPARQPEKQPGSPPPASRLDQIRKELGI